MRSDFVRVGLIGFGNVGSHLARVLSKHHDIRLTVYQRHSNDKEFAELNINFTSDWSRLDDSEIILVAVKDEAIEEVLAALKAHITSDPIVAHCAGSVSSEVIRPYFHRYGVLYPLQTFSRDKKLDYKSIPIFITAGDQIAAERLGEVAAYISPVIQQINDDQRMALHIAGVFSCNYTNAFYTIAHQICSHHDIPFAHLMPLIEETASKIRELAPQEAQTGPAIRGDFETVRKHEQYLSVYNPELEEIYRIIAQFIHDKK